MNYSKIWKDYRAGDGPRFHAIWDDSSIPGRPAVPWWDSTGPESTETRYLGRDTGPGPRFPGSGPWFRYHHRPGIEGFSARLSY